MRNIGGVLVHTFYLRNLNANTTGGYAEGFAEIQKSWHSLNHAEYASSMNYSTFNTADIVDATCGVTAVATGTSSYQNAFAIAQELETFAQRSDVMLSGLNTLSYQIFFEANIGNTAGTGPAAAYTLDFFGCYDIILVLDAGLLSAKF